MTGVEDLSDPPPPSHWAYDASQSAKQHGLMQGYPDGSFRGEQPTTRFETATILKTLVRSLERDLSSLDASKASKTELSVLNQLHRELQGELHVVEGQTRGLEERAQRMDDTQQEQGKRLSLLEKVQIHGDMSAGILSDFGSQGIGAGSNDGLSDAMSALGRVRLNLSIPVVEGKPDSKVGEGMIYAQMIGAYGRYAPAGGESGNEGANYPFSLYSVIGTDASGYNEGFDTGSFYTLNGSGQTRPNVYVESAYYSQHFNAGLPILSDLGLQKRLLPKDKDWETSGDLYVGLGRWWDLFDLSPYRGNELMQFQNSALVNIPGIAVNYAMPLASYTWHQGLGKSANLDVATAVGSMDVGDLMDMLNVTYEARLNYVPTFLGEKYAKAGTFYAGGYHIFNAGNQRFNAQEGLVSMRNRSGQSLGSLTEQGTTNAFYLGWNQEWMREIGTSFGYVHNNDSANVTTLVTSGSILTGVRQAFNAAVSVPVSALGIKKRPKDYMGLGYAFVELDRIGPTGNTEYNNRLEQLLEGYYRWQVNDNINIIPSFQLIANRLGLQGNGLSTVLALRVNYLF